MKRLLITFRAAQLFAHYGHNVVSGSSFFADHAFLGDLYDAYTESYDAIAERVIGKGAAEDLLSINITAAELAKEVGKDNPTKAQVLFKILMSIEKDICKEIDKAMESASSGTQNLLQGLADASEQRQYKIKQRLGE